MALVWGFVGHDPIGIVYSDGGYIENDEIVLSKQLGFSSCEDYESCYPCHAKENSKSIQRYLGIKPVKYRTPGRWRTVIGMDDFTERNIERISYQYSIGNMLIAPYVNDVQASLGWMSNILAMWYCEDWEDVCYEALGYCPEYSDGPNE